MLKGKINGRHKGARVFIYGCAPSLELALPLSGELKHFPSIGLNFSWRHISSTYLVVPDFCEWPNPVAQGFFATRPERVFAPRPRSFNQNVPYNAYDPYENRPPPHRRILSPSWDKGLYTAGNCNSTIIAVNLAYIFGAAEIVLVGVELLNDSHIGLPPTHQPYNRSADTVKYLKLIADILFDFYDVKCFVCSPNTAVKRWIKAPLSALL